MPLLKSRFFCIRLPVISLVIHLFNQRTQDVTQVGGFMTARRKSTPRSEPEWLPNRDTTERALVTSLQAACWGKAFLKDVVLFLPGAR